MVRESQGQDTRTRLSMIKVSQQFISLVLTTALKPDDHKQTVNDRSIYAAEYFKNFRRYAHLAYNSDDRVYASQLLQSRRKQRQTNDAYLRAADALSMRHLSRTHVLITFHVKHQPRDEMYVGHGRLSVCLCVCPAPHSYTVQGPGCNFGEGQGVPSSCAELGEFAIGVRVSLLWRT